MAPTPPRKPAAAPPKAGGNLVAPGPRLGKAPVEQSFLGAKATTTPLDGDVAVNYLPNVIEIVALGAQLVGAGFEAFVTGKVPGDEDLARLVLMLPPARARELLELVFAIADAVVSSTVLIVDGVKYELSNGEHRTALRDDRPDLWLPVVVMAGRITFQRFFPEAVLRELATRRHQGSQASSPST